MNQGKRRMYARRRRRRQRRAAALLICFAVLTGVILAGAVIIWGQVKNYTVSYESDHFNTNVYQGSMFSSDLCVAAEEVDLEGFEPDADLHAAGLFD